MDENDKEFQDKILKASRTYLEQTGNSAHIPIENLEQRLGIKVGQRVLETNLKALDKDQKLEIIERDENCFTKAIKLAHWTIRNSGQ